MSLWPPTDAALRAFLASQEGQPFTYAAVGATRGGNPPPGFSHDHRRTLLGRGPQAFDAACAALRHWRQFPPGWTRPFPPDAPLAAGQTVVIAARVFGTWMLNACRIVYVLDEVGPPRRFGFAYGTLPGHVEQGEELFLIEELPDGTVWYDLLAFSRPRLWLARLGYPATRWMQKRFSRASAAALVQTVRA